MSYRGLFAGLTTIDIQYFVDSFPGSNQKIKTNPPDIFVGGPATNAAIAFSLLNGEANLFSVTGSHAFSQFVNLDFIKNNINHLDLADSAECEPVLASVITSTNNGDRNVFTNHPASVTSTVQVFKLFEALNPHILLLDGYYPEFVLEIAHIAKERRIPVVLDCGSWKSQYNQLLPTADVVICSADFFPPGCENENNVVEFLHDNYGIRKLAISRGEKSLIYFSGGRRGEIPVEQIEIIDSLGAGDFLHGAFCYYWLTCGNNFIKALEHAVKLATFTCMYKGTRSWMNKFISMNKVEK